jgi:hypothetical protein
MPQKILPLPPDLGVLRSILPVSVLVLSISALPSPPFSPATPFSPPPVRPPALSTASPQKQLPSNQSGTGIPCAVLPQEKPWHAGCFLRSAVQRQPAVLDGRQHATRGSVRGKLTRRGSRERGLIRIASENTALLLFAHYSNECESLGWIEVGTGKVIHQAAATWLACHREPWRTSYLSVPTTAIISTASYDHITA